MKTYTIIKGFFAVGVLSVVLSGCSEDAMDRINKDHGHTQSVAGRFILTDVITSTAFSNAGGDLNTYLSSYIEYEVGVDNQLYYAETRESEPTSSSTFNNTWNNLYSTLKSARIIINQCSDGGIDYGNYTTKGMAEVLAAYNCALIADMFGDAPCSQAALVDENGSPVYLNPKMDKQEDIYKQAMQYLDDELTLRSNSDEINDQLEAKLNDRLSMAGIEVIEARINYLAYAPEIAAVMLRRQQADAIISAREKIVEGAVTMVKMALDRLADDRIVELDEERKAAMVSNLLVVLCADEAAQPIVNAGTLHH